MDLGNKELTRANLGSKELTRIHLGIKELWVNTAPDIKVFTSEIAAVNVSYNNGYKETSRFIDENYFNSVTNPLNLFRKGTDSDKVKTVTTKAYEPTEKALKKYKYANVTVAYCVASSYGVASLKFGETTLANNNTWASATEVTFKIPLNNNTNIVQYINNMSSGETYQTCCNMAIRKVVLTNSEE